MNQKSKERSFVAIIRTTIYVETAAMLLIFFLQKASSIV
jgi:hypothetical protein